MKRFNQELEIAKNPSNEVILSAMINEMKAEEPLLAELAQGSTTCTLQQFASRIEVYLRKEEAIKKLEKTPKPLDPPCKIHLEGESSSRKRKEAISTERQDRCTSQNWTPLNASLSAVFMEARKDPSFKLPPKMRTPLTKHSNQKYCKYHQDHDHWTEECVSLKNEIEMFIQHGKLETFIAKNEGIKNCP